MLAIIGGTGLYDLPGLVIDQRISGDTPFGTPTSCGGGCTARMCCFLPATERDIAFYRTK